MLSIGIMVFDGVEMRDFSGLCDVFSTATAIDAQSHPFRKKFRCFLVAANMQAISTRTGVKIIPACLLPPSREMDVLVIPGGNMAGVLHSHSLRRWIDDCVSDGMLTIAVGQGASLLGTAALRKEKSPGTSKRSKAETDLQPSSFEEHYANVISCASGSGSLDAGLQLVAQWGSEALADETARQMGYRWKHERTGQAIRHANSGGVSLA